MTYCYFCPKCQQTDKGFSRQELVDVHIANDGTTVSKPEPISDTALYYCKNDDCDWGGVTLRELPMKRA